MRPSLDFPHEHVEFILEFTDAATAFPVEDNVNDSGMMILKLKDASAAPAPAGGSDFTICDPDMACGALAAKATHRAIFHEGFKGADAISYLPRRLNQDEPIAWKIMNFKSISNHEKTPSISVSLLAACKQTSTALSLRSGKVQSLHCARKGAPEVDGHILRFEPADGPKPPHRGRTGKISRLGLI